MPGVGGLGQLGLGRHDREAEGAEDVACRCDNSGRADDRSDPDHDCLNVIIGDAAVGGGTGVVTVVWRVVVVLVSGWLEQESSIKAKAESAEPSMIAFFIVCIVFQ